MKKKSKYLQLLLIIALTISIVGCGKENKKDVFKIGILQPIAHESLDAARKGFIDGLAEEGFKDGDSIEIDYKNANGDQANNNTIADTFVSDKKDLVLAIGTPAAQSIVNKTKSIPVLFTAVTDPVASGLVESIENVGGNVTGTSDKVPIDKQIEILFSVKPDIKRIGFLYSSSEDNSIIAIKEAKKYVETKKGVEVKDITVQNSNDIQSVLSSSIDSVDAIYIPTDNTIASSMPLVYKLTEAKNIPVVPGAIDMVQDGAVGTVGMDYYSLGKQTAKMAVSILKKEKTIDKIPVEFAKEEKTVLKDEVIKKLGLKLPEDK